MPIHERHRLDELLAEPVDTSDPAALVELLAAYRLSTHEQLRRRVRESFATALPTVEELDEYREWVLSGATPRDWREEEDWIVRLESFGLVEGRSIGREKVYEGDALAVATLAAAFLERGLEPRHLRMFKVAAEREASVYEQLVLSLTRQRDQASRREAQQRLSELADLGNQLRLALLRQAVRSLTGDR